MPASSTNIPVKPERPVDNLKFTAYKKIVDSYEEACELIRKKKPVLGEPIVVPYYSDKEAGTIQLLFGIGSADIDAPYMRSSENNFIGDDILITDGDELIPLKEKLNNITEDAVEEVLDRIKEDEEIINELAEAIIRDSHILDNVVDEKLNQKLSWKSLSDLINS